MAHKDGSGYYTMVTLVENGQSLSRRIHRMSWQDEGGRVHVSKGKALPGDLFIWTGTGFKDDHFANFLGVNTAPAKSWRSVLPTKSDLVYVVIGIVSVLMLKAALVLATTPF